MWRELIDLQRRVLGREHPSTLATINNLALSLGGQGKHTEAEQIQRELLDVRRRVLGPEHPDTLTTMGNLANSRWSQGKHAEAEQEFRELLDVRRRVLGPEHPDTLATLRDLTSRAVGSEDGVQMREPRTSSAPPDPHPDAPPAKRARR
jgi:hypothetical protein